MVENGIYEALEHLNSPEFQLQMSPALKLRLGWEYHIVDWIRPALKALLTMPFPRLTAQDLRFMEPTISAAILSAHSVCLGNRLSLILYVWPLSHSTVSCDDTIQCGQSWEMAYLAATRHFAHTAVHYSGYDVYDKIAELCVPGLNSACKQITLNGLSDSGGLWKAERIAD